MKFDYLAAFPLPEELLSPKLRELLTPVGLSANISVEVAAMQETDQDGKNSEILHLQMAVVKGTESQPIEILREASDGVVQFSVPIDDHIGCNSTFKPSISGHDYIIAAWGNSSFYVYNLSEKVWMTLGSVSYTHLTLPKSDLV